MKRFAAGIMALAVCIGFTGCNSPPDADSDKTMFDFMQEEVAKISDDGGMASVGIGQSSSQQLSVTKAKVEARKNLAQLVQVKIENLEKAFVEEIGEAGSSEMNELFTSATKQITSQTLQGTMPKMQKFEEDDGVYTAYVLMVLDPDVIPKSLESNNSAKHLYERFRASKAFEELDKEIKEFDEAERQGMLGM